MKLVRTFRWRACKLFCAWLIWCSVLYAAFRYKPHLWYSRTTNFGPSYTESGRLLLQKVNTTDGSSSKIYNLILAKPLVDNSPSLPDSEYAKILQSEIPNLPIRYWQSLNNKFPAKNATCAIFPSLIDLQFNNVYWQTLKTSNGTFHLYGAYYDNRTLLAMEPVVRMLGMINRIEPTVQTICQLWFDGLEAPVFAEVSKYQLVWVKEWGNHKNGLFQPYLWSCKIPVDYRHLVPESVSLVEKPCDMAVTNLMVINNLPEGGKKGEFAVCVKGLDFPKEDLSVRLVEWFETLRHLGAEKIFLYELEVHPNITKVLNYYKKLGGGCLSYSVDTDDAQLQHYRADCVAELMSKCDGFKNFNVRDDAILRHKVPIISRSDTANLNQSDTANLNQSDTTNLNQSDTTNRYQSDATNLNQSDTTNCYQSETTNPYQSDTTNLYQSDTANLNQSDTTNLNQSDATNLNQSDSLLPTSTRVMLPTSTRVMLPTSTRVILPPLPEYLLDHPAEYQKYHFWRRRYRVLNEHGFFQSPVYHMCRLCEALNYNDKTDQRADLEHFFDSSEHCYAVKKRD
ncbi:hypothetical protein HAZT_HAZT003640 [Hyalella azteca]|uniref:Glycosyltransferase family 92 protein n=1 Tax=Hyalella azteca TaxID=294128 RepID=A0A6A0HBS3_HYAAZ|nr:hypothetical protein HAZT_HAZT003640 [Hyalella azteca]